MLSLPHLQSTNKFIVISSTSKYYPTSFLNIHFDMDTIHNNFTDNEIVLCYLNLNLISLPSG